MFSTCCKAAIFAQVFAVSFTLGPNAFAKSDRPDKAHQSCQHLPQREAGNAMFYGPGFNGKLMANGQVFDMNALTASSRTLPLGTRAQVTNTHTRRSTIVTITDRGSFRAKHVIVDLSVGAAKEIGLTEREGVAPVEIKPLGCTVVARANHAAPHDARPENISNQ
jgi:rare lipoprotein A